MLSGRYSEAGQWAIYEGDKTLLIGHDFGLSETGFMIKDPAFRSVTDDKTYKLKLIFVKGRELDDGWGEVNARGVVADTGKGIQFELVGEEALDDLAASRTLAIKRDDIIIESLALDGSALAI